MLALKIQQWFLVFQICCDVKKNNNYFLLKLLFHWFILLNPSVQIIKHHPPLSYFHERGTVFPLNSMGRESLHFLGRPFSFWLPRRCWSMLWDSSHLEDPQNPPEPKHSIAPSGGNWIYLIALSCTSCSS